MKNRLLKNSDISFDIVRYLVSVVAVLFIGSILIFIQGENPVYAMSLILRGAFGNPVGFGSTVRYAMPCIILATAAAMAFQAGVNNLGLEGQLYFGSLVAAVIGYKFNLPVGLHLITCLLGAGAAGLLWGLIPALLKLLANVDELISTLMANFIATLLTEYIVMWWIMGGKASAGSNAISTPSISDNARLPTLIPGTSSSYGIIIAILVAIAVYVFYKYTIKGYELRQVGENIRFARIGGINIKASFLLIFMASGFLSGLAGGVEITGSYYKFTANYAKNMGWNGIMIAYICNKNPLAIIFVSFIWGALQAGALNMERNTDLNKLTINILQMLFVLFISVDYKAIYSFIKTKGKNTFLRSAEVGR